jgi:hypothetical protein
MLVRQLLPRFRRVRFHSSLSTQSDSLELVEQQLAELHPGSPLMPMLLAQKGKLLAEDYRLHEALETLHQAASLGANLQESIDTMKVELKVLLDEMEPQQHHRTGDELLKLDRPRVLPPSTLLPPHMEVREVSPGQLGLFTKVAVQEGHAVFNESPWAVLPTEGDDACIHCMRPLQQSRRVVDSQGHDISRSFTPQQIENLNGEVGLPLVEADQSPFCSEHCALAHSKTPLPRDGDDDETGELITLLSKGM